MLLLAICTRKTPFHGKVYAYVVYHVGSGKLQPDIPDQVPQDLKEVMRKCWQVEPRKRPTIDKILEAMYNSEDVKLVCKECKNYITNASYIRTKGCHYTCIDPEIKQRIKIVGMRGRQFRTTINTGVFACVKEDCGQLLGITIDFLDQYGEDVTYHGYGFKIGSFRFELPHGALTYKKWKVVPVDFQEHQYSGTLSFCLEEGEW
ncbi:uncharacterized protein [Amphiura filiformis]|uniref:uncharacterized protein n=1 Tax=Amphiura filiformis TaxID=82378 RepID=UPI003B2270D7